MKQTPVLAILLLFAVACASNEDAHRTPVPAATPLPSLTTVPTPRQPFVQPALTVQEREAMQRAIIEAAVFSAKGADCSKLLGLPAPNQPCVSLVTSPITARARDGSLHAIFGSSQDFGRGIAVYRVDHTGDEHDYYGIIGAGPAGSWLSLETFTNAPFFQLQLPGEMIACPRSASARVYASPSPNQSGNEVRGNVPQGQRLRVESFLQIQQGPPVSVNPGWGFYRVTAPVDGWIDSREAVASFWGDCTEKYAFDGSHPVPAPNSSSR